jgi:Uma2 family endonuclease
MPLTKSIKKYTYQDYINFSDDKRCEIIDGEFYDMTPAPKTKHQKISIGILEKLILNKEKFKGCDLFSAPTDVVFDEYNVVQPDIFIVCDNTKITEDNIKGAPDLIVEIIWFS